MELNGKTVLILGGSGLVGRAVVRKLLSFAPKRIVLVALYEEEVEQGAAWLRQFAGDTIIDAEWGDVFLPTPVDIISHPFFSKRLTSSGWSPSRILIIGSPLTSKELIIQS